jgi:hypothetical protein
VVNKCQAKACENNGHFNYFAIGRLVYAKLLDKNQHGRGMEESAPEILGDSRTLSFPNKGTEVDSQKGNESFPWKTSLWQSECFMTLYFQGPII